MLRRRAAGAGVRPVGQSAALTGAARAQGYDGRRASTASSSTTTTSSGSPATARRTASCSSSRWTASSCCRSASRARATTAIRPNGSARRPTSRSMSPAKEVFAADGYANRRVVVFDSRDRRLQAPLGRLRQQAERREDAAPTIPRKPPSQQFGNPVHCIRLGKDGLVYVCDRTNNRLQVFRKDGTLRLRAHLREGHARQRHGLRPGVLARRGAEATST